MRIAVGISGGVDSSVAAWKLLQEGHDVFGVFMINWHDTEGTLSGDCPWEDDLMYARMTAKRLGIRLEVVDLSEEYRERIANYMFREYEAGRTPNPDILCNREIKWDVFANKAIELGAEMVATGHYCRRGNIDIDGHNYAQLFRGKDIQKDQSYFLCQTTQKQLSKALFPIGNMQKSEVRHIAKEQGLAPYDRKDSQGLCFIGKIDLPTFLKQKLTAKEGHVIEITRERADEIIYEHNINAGENINLLSQPYKLNPNDGDVIGSHQGAHFFTIGQRKGLGIGGTKLPLFVLGTDTQQNIIYVGQGDMHPLLFRSVIPLRTETINILRPIPEHESHQYEGVIRYRQSPEKMRIVSVKENYFAVFDNPQKGVASGQFCAWYLGEELIGSAMMD